MNPKVDAYINNADNWQKEMELLRSILLNCGLTEELKWRVPCYTFENANIIILGKFKEYVTLSFFKGVLLEDSKGILVKPGENSQTVKMAKFTSTKQIKELSTNLESYIYEAIEVEKAGLKAEFKESTNFTLAEEIQDVLNQNSTLKKAFESLTIGRQRAYNIFVSGAKQSKTRTARIEKYIPRILIGKGINDCTCGHSKRLPNCDGSHKLFGIVPL